MKIKVNRRHIRDGERESWECCPVALAIREQLGVSDIQVGQGTIKCGRTKVEASQRVQNFIDRFDEGKPVKPFVFEFSL